MEYNHSKRYLILCTAPDRMVLSIVSIIDRIKNGHYFDFLVPRKGEIYDDLIDKSHNVIAGGWLGLFNESSIDEEQKTALIEKDYSCIFILLNNSSGSGYSELIAYFENLGETDIKIVYPNLYCHSSGKTPRNEQMMISFERLFKLMQIEDKKMIDDFYYDERAYPDNYTTQELWTGFGGIFETTFLCNFTCPHCPREVAGLDTNSSIDPLLFEHYISDPKIQNITLLGLGETLMNPEFEKISSYIAKRKLPVSLITNGSLLSKKKLALLGDTDLTIVVSIDGADEKMFGKLRKSGQFDGVINKIKTIRKAYPHFKFCVNSVVSIDNYHQLSGFVEIAAEIGSQQVSILDMLALDEKNDAKIGYWLPENSRRDFLIEATNKAIEHGIQFQGKPVFPSLSPCHSPWRQMYVDMNGDVYPCCFIYRIPEDEFDEYFLGEKIKVPLAAYRLGNLKHDRLEDLWSSKAIKEIRRILLESQENTQLDLEEFQKLRQSVSLDNPYNYCRICLYRWNCAC